MCQSYASAAPMLSASIGPVHAQFWHIHGMFTEIRCTIIYLMTYSANIISFDNDVFDNHLHIQLLIGQPHALIHCPHWMVLVWFWSSLLAVELYRKSLIACDPCACVSGIFFSFEPMLMIRLKIVGDVKYTCKIAHCGPVNVRNVCSSLA